MNSARLLVRRRFSRSVAWILPLACVLMFGTEARAVIFGPQLYSPTVTNGSLDASPSPVPSVSAVSSWLGSNVGLIVKGDYSFTSDSTHTTASISYLATDSFYLSSAFSGDLYTLLDGSFSIKSGSTGRSATLTGYAVTATLSNGTTQSFDAVSPSSFALPIEPDQPLHVSMAESTPVSLASGYYNLSQTVTVTFNVDPNTDIHIDFPNTTQLTSVPEPSTVTELSTGGVFTVLVLAWLRWKRS